MPLTASWDSTVTNSIWSDATTLYVAGYGANSGTSNEKAFLSTRAIPTPGAASVLALGGLLATRRRRAGLADRRGLSDAAHLPRPFIN